MRRGVVRIWTLTLLGPAVTDGESISLGRVSSRVVLALRRLVRLLGGGDRLNPDLVKDPEEVGTIGSMIDVVGGGDVCSLFVSSARLQQVS